ncbi:MAG: DUF1178 family protein, partial [Limnohabitans sp.]
SEEDYQSQRERNLVECPVCADSTIHKRLSAPRLNLLTSRLSGQSNHDNALTVGPESASLPESSALQPPHDAQKAAQMAWLNMVQHVIANTEDVGPDFAEEVRKMHYGETAERQIRGQVSLEETRSLLEEGIPVMPLTLPAALKGSVH